MKNIQKVIALGLLLTPFSIASSVKAFTPELKRIESVIENHVGTKVLWSNGHEACNRNTFGFYNPSKDIVVMCQENHRYDYQELVATLKHEGWYAVQVKCNKGRAALSDDQIRTHMNRRTRGVLHDYPHKQHRSEAEARVVELIPTPNWIQGVKTYCS